jgi:hypothetical protein
MLKLAFAMRIPFHILTLLIFALTQCFAPFIHAHVDGVDNGTSIHTHEIQRHIATDHPHIESYESQSVTPAHEYQRDDALVIAVDHASTTHPSSPCISIVSVGSPASIRSIAFAFQKPHTQAPPRFS